MVKRDRSAKGEHDWLDPSEEKIVARIEQKARQILKIKEEIEAEREILEKLARKKEDASLTESLEESAYFLNSVEQDIKDFTAEITDARLPEASNLLEVLEEKVGDLR